MGCKRTDVEVSTLTDFFSSESPSSPPGLSLSNSVVSVSASTITSGSTTTITLQLRDENNNPLNTFGGHSVVFAHSAGGSSGTFSATIDNGDGTYSTTLTGITAGSAIQILATINSQAVTSAAPTVTVVPGPASKLLFVDQPTSAYKNRSFTVAPKVGIYDLNDNLVLSANNSINISIFTNPSGGTLAGTTTLAANSGYAQFSGLSINNPGTGYKLEVTSAGLIGAIGSSLNILDTALLTISDGPTYNYGTVAMQSTMNKTFTITNSSTVTASITIPSDLTAPFNYSGGGYPGAGGTCGPTLAAAASCTIVVQFAPTAMGSSSLTLTIQYDSGGVQTPVSRDIQGIGGPLLVTVNPIYALTTSDWSFYYRPTGSAPYALCDGTESNGRMGVEQNSTLFGCVHSGEARKVVVPTRSTCNNLSINDTLNTFQWKCTINASSFVEFRTTGLKPGKGLRDLISGTSWISNKVNVLENATTIAESNYAPWWTNPIMNAPSASAASQVLSTSGAIYVASSYTNTRGYNINADHISFLTANSTELNWDPTSAVLNTDLSTGESTPATARSILSSGGQKFLWIEASFNHSSTNSQYAVFLSNTKFSRIHRSLIKGNNASNSGSLKIVNSFGIDASEIQGLDLKSGFYIGNTNHFYLRKFQYGKNTVGPTFKAITLDSLTKFSITDFIISGLSVTSSYGIYMYNSADGVIANGSISSVNGYGVHFEGTRNTILTGLTATGISNTAVNIIASSFNNIITHSTLYLNYWSNVYLNNSMSNTFTQLLTGNTLGKSIELDTSNYNTLINITALQSSNEIYATSTSNYTRTAGTFLLSAGANCGSNFTEGLNLNCSAKSDGFGFHTISSTGLNLGSSFVGHSFDSKNLTADGTGLATYTGLNLAASSWVTFENLFRGWLTSTTFGAAIQRQACVSGSCQISDFSLKSNDTLVRNTSMNSAGNSAFPTDSATCNARFNNPTFVQEYIVTSVPAGATEINTDAIGNNNTLCEVGEYCQVPRNFILHATEIMGDGLGNENGLCEPNESCLFSPNYGSYQGHAGVGTFCTISTDPFTGTKIYNPQSNGY